MNTATQKDFTQVWNDTKQQLRNAGCTFFHMEKTINNYKEGVITYQNRLCEWWTATIINGKLTDVMMRAASQEEARANQVRWESFL